MAPRAAKDADDAARNRTHAAQAPWQLVVGLFYFFLEGHLNGAFGE